MTFRTICAALAVALALPAVAQEDLGLDLTEKKPAPKAAPKPKAPAAAKPPADAKAAPAADAKAAAAVKAAPAAKAAVDARPAPAAEAKKPAAADAKPAPALEAKKPAAAPAPAAAPSAGAAVAPAAKAAAMPAPPAKPAPELIGIELDTTKIKTALPKDLDLMDVPGFDDLDLKIADDVALCIFPFIKEDKLNEGGPAGGKAAKAAPKNLEAIQKIFYDVAKSSPLLKDATLLGKDAPACAIEDTACIAKIGNINGCQAVLAGRSTREDNGFTLRARMVNAKAGKLMGKVNQVMATDDDTQVAAWAEGQACRALKVDCKATVTLDADRPDMKVMLDNRPLDRKPAAIGPEVLTLSPGVYKIRVMIGQRNSREEVLALRRGGKETVHVRQLADGGIPLSLASAMQKGAVPAKSVEVAGGKWTKPVGIVVAGLGVVAAGFGAQQYFHAKGLTDDTNKAFAANGGYLKPADLPNVSSAKTANSNSKIAYAVGAGLVVVGALFVFVF